MKLSNFFTLLRLLFAPVFFVLFMFPIWTGTQYTLISFVCTCLMLPLLALAEFTDFWDGFFARRLNDVSDFGKIFDPVADVILHLTTFFCYVHTGKMFGFVFLLIFYREFIMLFVRCVAAKNGTAIAARKGGKLKTVFYIATSFVCLFCETLSRLQASYPPLQLSQQFQFLPNLILIGKIMGVFCVGFCYISFVDYLLAFKDVLKKQ